MKHLHQTGRQNSGARWAIRPAAECFEVWFWLTVILFVSFLMSGAVISAFEPRLWGGPARHQLLVQHVESPGPDESPFSH
jgi:hypothetical protein